MTTDFEFRLPPRRHQRLAWEAAQDKDVFAYLMGPGTGKTKTALDDAAVQFQEGRIDQLVAFADIGIHRQWVEEQIPIHFTKSVPYHAAYYRPGLVNKEIRAVLAKTKPGSGRLSIVTLNTEMLSSPSGLTRAREIMAGRRTMLVVDESQRIKTPNAARTKAMWKLGQEAVIRRIATGSDITKGYEDLYGQFRFLDWKILQCRTFAEFKAMFCVLLPGVNYTNIIGYQNVEELQARIAPWAFMVEKKDCLDIPESHSTVYVEHTPEQRKHYEELRTLYLTEVNQQLIEAPLAIQRMGHLLRINSGHIRDADGTSHSIASNRVARLLDLLENARGKVIVWAAWRDDVADIMESLAVAGVPATDYHGGNTADVNAANLRRFQTDPKVKAFVATPAKAGTGLNIQQAPTAIFYSHTTNYEAFTQALSRNHRDGQTEPVMYYHLVTPGTLDVRVRRTYELKQGLIETFRDPNVFKRWLLEPALDETDS